MAVVRLFASAREAAGLSVDRIDGHTLGEVLDEARRRYGERFAAVLTHSRVWVNGQPADVREPLRDADVVAVLPPVSGGSDPDFRGTRGRISTPSSSGPQTRPPLEEPLPLTKADSQSPSGWFRPPDIEGALARMAPPVPVAEPQLNGKRAAAAPVRRQPLTAVPDTDKPHVRLGLAWSVVTIAAIAGGQTSLAIWLSLVAALAAVQVTRVWVERHERPVSYVAVAGAAAMPLAALGGLDTLNIIIVLVLVVTMVARVSTVTKAPSRDVALTLMIILPIGLATAALVLLRHIDLAAPLALFAFAAAYDVGNYLVGTGAANEWEGPVAGIASIVCVTLFVAVLVPSFGGAGPFLLGALAALLAPLGPLAASIVLGDRDAKAPALRRIDSLLLLAPMGAWLAAVLIR
ncbi:MAG: MoaD/ThiS family protein [Acidimicrobiia bacterium]|nr:MoaD/ThiS family protein [Acidimicrobiia bacterium]MBV9041110.1 MoaD/ThiS family protein [Acidimicrobiia bacterium]